MTRLKRYVWSLVLLVCVGFSSSAYAVTHAEIQKLLSVAQTIYKAYQFLDGSNSEDVHQEILMAITNAAREIEATLNALASMGISEIEACVDATLLGFENFISYKTGTKQVFALEGLECLTRIVRLMDERVTHTNPWFMDRVGRAFNIMGPLTLFVHKYLYPDETTELLRYVEEGHKKVLTKLRPFCSIVPAKIGAIRSPRMVTMTCRAYNGDTASSSAAFLKGFSTQERARLEDHAARNTSYIIAKAVLAGL